MKAQETINQAVRDALSGLKDFQQETVRYVQEQLYEKGRSKMLVADEVGLGKTIVAKGLIAKAFQRHVQAGIKRDFHVIYICSNQALAAQNLKKLNLFQEGIEPIGRLIYLVYEPKASRYGFRLSSLTPGTSFYPYGGPGEAEERLILFTLLTRYRSFETHKNGLRYLLIGGVRDPYKWKEWSDSFQMENRDHFRKDIFKKFRLKIQEPNVRRHEQKAIFHDLGIRREKLSLWTVVKHYSRFLWGKNYKKYPSRGTVVGLLRQALTEVCLEYLNADLFILDEFQRYRELIGKDENSSAARLARDVFGNKGAKTLMLSATPFKPYTGSMDLGQGEDHYAEFELVLKFLMEEREETFWNRYEEDRKAFFQFLRRPKEALRGLDEAVRTKQRLEGTYREAMVRTERVLVSDDHNMLLSSRLKKPFPLKVEDVKDFIQTDRIARALRKATPQRSLCSPMEYSKSAPFPLSFMDRYKLKELLHRYKRNPKMKKTLKANSDCWVNLKKIGKYRPLAKNGLPNGKLRFLLEDMLYSGGWKLLWAPPTLPYYKLTGPYEGQESFSKTLVFSSWVLVPRMIATLVSYEAERLTIGDKGSMGREEKKQKKARKYFYKGNEKTQKKKEKRRPRPQFVFSRKRKIQAAGNMTNFCILYPSPTLAELYHPRQNLRDDLPVDEIRKRVRGKIRGLFRELDLKRFETEEGEPDRWYWAAPLLLDRYSDWARAEIADWMELSYLPGDSDIDPEAGEDRKEEKSREYDHFYELYEAFENPEGIGLGNMPDDLEDVLVDMVLGSPAVAAFRALKEYFPSPFDAAKGATIIGKGFLSLFNKPESISIIRLFTSYRTYWRKVLEYCTSGNIQAMVDEFVFLLFECEHFQQNAEELADHFSTVMNIRTSNVRVDSLKSFLDTNENPTMRCHFALDFGGQRIETASGKRRVINLREAFNSPFRPFILASTSIGQEGLDFHYYCRKVLHWNLPANAIDIEQREGRINRYMGHVIRRNVAAKYTKDLSDPLEMPWQQLFLIAKERECRNGKCELVPFWHVESEDGIRIERIVPLHPFSKDAIKLKYLLEVLTFYRLTFGQPRQEELVEALMKEGLAPEDLDILRENLMINLSPIAQIAQTMKAHSSQP